jgi:hypothetical protein
LAQQPPSQAASSAASFASGVKIISVTDHRDGTRMSAKAAAPEIGCD